MPRGPSQQASRFGVTFFRLEGAMIVTDDLVSAEEVLEEARLRLKRAIIEYELAEGAYRQAKKDAAWDWCYENRILPGRKVLMEFEEGEEVVFFEKLDANRNSPVIVRHFTKKGRPCKENRHYEWHYVKIMRRLPDDSTPADTPASPPSPPEQPAPPGAAS
jgi:hypothetical protein